MSEQRRALITGISGQDGSFLAEFLLHKNYEVFGLVRRTSISSLERLEGIEEQVTLLPGDLLDASSLLNALERARPHEVYNLAAQSFVPASWSEPVSTAEVTALGVTRLLEAVRHACPEARFYQASTSEMFGQAPAPQSEDTPFHPRSPYGVAKVYAHWATVNQRESYDCFAVSGILFNHESERRGQEFVTRKISRGVARISLGLQDKLVLGNLEARRDWGFAGDYVRAMWLILQQDEPLDLVIATGKTHSVGEFCERAFGEVDLDWREHVETSPRYRRPAEVDLLVGDASRARELLGWRPQLSFEDLVRRMVTWDVHRAHRALEQSQAAAPDFSS
jgi:GDPmannose 4,6-dehydratase